MIDHALWEVIENGTTLPKTKVVECVTTETPITTAEEKAQRRLEVKARSTLIMDIPNEHQLKFNSIKDAKKLLEVVEKRFEDVNQKLLRSLSPEWNTHVVVWRNKADLDTMSMDDLYNNLNMYEPEVNTAHGVSTASTQVNAAFSINIDNLSDAVICSFFASQPNSSQLVHEDLEQIHSDDMKEIDLRWQMVILTMRARRDCRALKNQDNKHNKSSRRSMHVETSNSTTLVSCDGLGGYDWSDQEEEGPNYALIALLSSNPESKIVDNCKKGLGYENYNVVPPSYIGNFMPPTPELSFTCLDEFVNKPVVKNCKAMSSKEEPKDETSGILKSFITKIENLEDHKVKVIRCDNGTEFKNKEMNLFCEIKGILRQNRVAGRRNKTLIEAARTMLTDSKLPTTFCAEAVNTACYVQNRVLVVNPQNKTPHEHFHGRTPTLSFMRPFECPVTILNIIDHLGKFDGKADKCFFLGYSLNSKSFYYVFNSRTRIVKENLHIRFSESTPNVVGSGPDWLFDIDALTRIMNYEPIIVGTQSNGFAGTKVNDNAGQARKEIEHVKDYILLQLWTADPPFSQDPKSSINVGSKPSSDDGKNVDEDPRKENKCKDQKKEDNVNITNNVNTVSSTVNVAGTN
uniref:Retroviral polymerase SH3-like domain-containing protein n=1 Tax=Tanacetum cinerariifolium TaxID=118510 RepID=A0A6L2NC94_TANCI|nr:hypothetical protein [Tanacetum cinerariifolium]